jgi:hypothetical protein
VATDGTVTDGPYPETKSVIGGFAVVDCPHARKHWSGLPRSLSRAAVRKRYGSPCPTRSCDRGRPPLLEPGLRGRGLTRLVCASACIGDAGSGPWERTRAALSLLDGLTTSRRCCRQGGQHCVEVRLRRPLLRCEAAVKSDHADEVQRQFEDPLRLPPVRGDAPLPRARTRTGPRRSRRAKQRPPGCARAIPTGQLYSSRAKLLS